MEERLGDRLGECPGNDLKNRKYSGNMSGFRAALSAVIFILCCMMMWQIQAGAASEKLPTYKKATAGSKRSDVIIYVGDSRTMFYAIWNLRGKNDCLIYQDGASIGALKYNKDYGKCSQLAKYLRSALKSYPNAKVVFNFGCNGCSHLARNGRALVKEYRKWIRAYPDRKFYVASVFPAADKKPYSRANMHYINKVLKKNFPDIYIDAGEYLERRGLDQTRSDGKGLHRMGNRYDLKHYSKYASRAVKNYIRSVVMAAG